VPRATLARIFMATRAKVMFESSLTSGAIHGHQRSASLSFALGVHLLALLPVAAISYLVVEDIADPSPQLELRYVPIPIALNPTPRPPVSSTAVPERGRPIPRLGKEGGGRPDAPPAAPAPSVAPADLDSVLESSTLDSIGDVGQGPGTEDAPFGSPLGRPDGFGDDIRGVDSPGEGDGPIPVLPDVDPPKLIRKVTPEYPPVARAAKISGTVIVQATISTTGDVVDASIVASRSELLNDAAIDAVRQWKYRPARRNGEPVAVYFTVRVEFSLQ